MHGAAEKSQKYADMALNGEFGSQNNVKLIFLQSGVVQGEITPWFKINREVPNDDPDRHSKEDIEEQCQKLVKIIEMEI